MKTRNLYWIIPLLILGTLIFTNPSHGTHMSAIDAEFAAKNPILGGWLNLGRAASAVTEYESYGVFSVTYLKQSEQEKRQDQKTLVSFGIFNRVFVDNLDIQIE